MEDNKFSFFVPIEIEKSGKTGEDRYDDMRFKGIASSPNYGRDKQGQILRPEGFDLTHLMNAGTINYHHLWKSNPLAIIGEPTVARITKDNELYIEGKLFKDSKLAREVYDAAEILQNNSGTRRMGFSIEGVPIEKSADDPDDILRARITNIAITPQPICPGTKMEIIKGGIENFEFTEEDKEYFVNIEKAMVAGSITGTDTTDQSLTQEPLKKESLDTGKKKKKKACADMYLTKAEVFYELISKYNMDAESCTRVFELAEAIEKGRGI